MPKVVFYAWQSQTDQKGNRSLIEEALEASRRSLAKHGVNFSIDQDTRGCLGSVEISAAILSKIATADAFVADVTPVGTLLNGAMTPNPNVMFELGFAWHLLPPAKILLVLNRAYGTPESQPFDISKRRLISYLYDPAQHEPPGPSRQHLASQLVDALAAALRDDRLDALRATGLTETDLRVFQLCYAEMLRQDSSVLEFHDVVDAAERAGVAVRDTVEAVQACEDQRLWEATQVIGGDHRYSDISATYAGLDAYCKAFLPEFNDTFTKIAEEVVGPEISEARRIASDLRLPQILVSHVFRLLDANEYVRCDESWRHVLEPRPKLKRILANQALNPTGLRPAG